VDVAHNGLDGVAAARRDSFDVVLCDVGLPDIDGCEVARRLRRIGEDPRRCSSPSRGSAGGTTGNGRRTPASTST
jgi:CheY-like chemotaxis protein